MFYNTNPRAMRHWLTVQHCLCADTPDEASRIAVQRQDSRVLLGRLRPNHASTTRASLGRPEAIRLRSKLD